MKTLKPVGLFVFGALLGGCQGKVDQLTQSKAFDLTLRAVQHYQLSELPRECLDFEEKNSQESYGWVIKEKQSSHCGGDPRIQSRFFEIRTHRQTGQITSDARSVPGDFLPLE